MVAGTAAEKDCICDEILYPYLRLQVQERKRIVFLIKFCISICVAGTAAVEPAGGGPRAAAAAPTRRKGRPGGPHPKLSTEVNYLAFYFLLFFGGIFYFFSYNIQHCFICRPSDSTVPTDAGIETRTVATGALAVRSSNH